MNSAVIGQNAHDFDQFFTKPEAVDLCHAALLSELAVSLTDFDLIVEPSCGEGAFLRILPMGNVLAMDIDSKDVATRKDFLLTDDIPTKYMHVQTNKRPLFGEPFIKKREGTCLTIGNPPFGKNSVTAMAFFNHAAAFSDVIAFIVPKTFMKTSTKDKINFHFFLVREIQIPDNSFTFKGKTADVPCVFQVWCHGKALSMVRTPVAVPPSGMRTLAARLLKTDDFVFVKVNELPDVIIRRVGVLAGKVFTTELYKWVTKNHYFIRVTDRTRVAEITQRLIDLDLENLPIKYATAGMPSISVTELCMAYNEKYKV